MSHLVGMLSKLMQLKCIAILTAFGLNFASLKILESFERTKLLKFGSHLKDLSCPAPSASLPTYKSSPKHVLALVFWN